ncbi:MAG: 2-hydroxyacid dehydrogenase, partial [Comamonadaceae bacterium]
MSSKIPLLALCSLSDAHAAELAARFELHHAPDAASRHDAVARLGGSVRVVLTIGTIGLTAAEIAAMPALELVCALGVGYENIDVPACRQRGITVANGADTNADCVADHAIGLLIAAVRGLVRLDRQCREGVWRDKILPPANVSGRRLGILGLGGIGERIA